MKKIFILIIAILCFVLILLASLFLYDKPETEVQYRDYSEIILSNSSWINLDKSDLNSLLLKTYSNNILTIIDSLENSIPIIVEVNGGQFAKENKNNFIVASAFASSSNIYIYVPKENGTYEKGISSLEVLLENAVRFFVINDEEVLG